MINIVLWRTSAADCIMEVQLMSQENDTIHDVTPQSVSFEGNSVHRLLLTKDVLEIHTSQHHKRIPVSDLADAFLHHDEQKEGNTFLVPTIFWCLIGLAVMYYLSTIAGFICVAIGGVCFLIGIPNKKERVALLLTMNDGRKILLQSDDKETVLAQIGLDLAALLHGYSKVFDG